MKGLQRKQVRARLSSLLPPHTSDPWTLGLPFQVPVQSCLHFVLVMVSSKLLSIAAGKEDPSKLFNILMNTMAVFLASGLLPLLNIISESLKMKIPYKNGLGKLNLICFSKSQFESIGLASDIIIILTT